MGRLLMATVCFVGTVLLAGGASGAEAEYPATFKSGRFYISTMKQFDERVAMLHPELNISKKNVEGIEYKNKNYSAMVLSAEGLKKGTLIEQKMTYIHYYPGLWRLLYVENKICAKGTGLGENKEWVEKWMCEEDAFPISGFSDLYIVEDENIDLAKIAPAFTDPIELYVEETSEDLKKQNMSLADLRRALEQVGSTMKYEASTYYAPMQEGGLGQQAIRILIEGRLDDEKRVKQAFVYVVVGDLLRLKEIDGVICRFEKSLNKEICDPIYVPTPVSSVPLVLLNSETVTGARPTPKEELGSQPPQLACGPLQNHMELVFKVHFERSLFDATSVNHFKKIVENFPVVADPMGLLLNVQEKRTFLDDLENSANFGEQLVGILEEMKKRKMGECLPLANMILPLRQKMVLKSGEVFKLMALLKQNNYDLDKLKKQASLLTPYQKSVLEKIAQWLDPRRVEVEKTQAVDVLLGKLARYIKEKIDRVSDLEEFVLSSMAKQDAYSQLIADTGSVKSALGGHLEKEYFGISVETGLSGGHYLARVHPLVYQQTDFEYGDRIVSINGVDSAKISAEKLDKLLQDTTKPINLVVFKKGQIQLGAQVLNPLDFFYDVNINEEGWVNIDLRSFEAGLAKELAGELRTLINKYHIKGFILDLRGNPGGNTDEAIKVMSLFVKDRIVSYSRVGSRNFAPLKAHWSIDDYFIDDTKPLIVKVDSQTMSASEVVTSGLKALRRSTTVGEPTFGKLVGQMYFPLVLENKKTGGLLLTAMEFYNVDGEALNGIGVTPDVITNEGVLPPHDFVDGLGEPQNLKPKDLQFVEKYNLPLVI